MKMSQRRRHASESAVAARTSAREWQRDAIAIKDTSNYTLR
jgi:hypothetical protein